MNYGTKPVKPKPKPKPKPGDAVARTQPMPFGKTPGRNTIMPVKPPKKK